MYLLPFYLVPLHPCLSQATLLQQELETGAAADDLDEASSPLDMGREMMSKLSGPPDTRSGRTNQ